MYIFSYLLGLFQFLKFLHTVQTSKAYRYGEIGIEIKIWRKWTIVVVDFRTDYIIWTFHPKAIVCTYYRKQDENRYSATMYSWGRK